MRLGISSWACTWACGVEGHPPVHPLTPLDLVEEAHRLGVHVLQIADNCPLAGLSEAALGAVRQRAVELGVSIEVGTRGIADGNLERHLELALLFGSPIVRVVVDTATHQPDMQEIAAALRGAIPRFEDAGVVLAVENHDRFTARALAGLVRSLESDAVGVCLDTVNSFGALEGPEVVVETLAPLTVNLHLKDFTIKRAPSMMGFIIEGCPLGRGRTPTEWILRKLREHGRDVNAILELWTPPAGDLRETIAREIAWREESVRYARTFVAD